MGNSAPCKIVTPENFIFWNFAHVIISGRLPNTQISVVIGTVEASLQIGEILPLCYCFDCPVLFISVTRPGRTAEPIFTLYDSNDVFLRKEVPLGG